jgi:hypothetical protein
MSAPKEREPRHEIHPIARDAWQRLKRKDGALSLDDGSVAYIKRSLLNAKRVEIEAMFLSFITMAHKLDRLNEIAASTTMLQLAAACGPALEVQSDLASARTHAIRDDGMRQFKHFAGQDAKSAPMFGTPPPKGAITVGSISGPISMRRRG